MTRSLQLTSVFLTVLGVYHWSLTDRIARPALTKPAARKATSTTARSTRSATARAVGVAHIWRESLDTFSAHSAAILLFGVMGFAGASVLCTAVSAALGLQFYINASGSFATRLGLSTINTNPSGIFDGHAVNVYALLLIQAALGLFAMSFARGAITYIALQRACDKPARIHKACRATLARLPALLIASLIFGGLMALGAIGINLLLHELNLNLSTVGERANSFEGLPGVIALRAVNSLMPDPGSPFAEFIPYWRTITLKQKTIDPSGFWLIAIGSIGLIFLADTLLRFRTVMIFNPPRSLCTPEVEQWSDRPQGFSPLAPLIESVHFGLHHLGQIVIHVCLLRLAILGVTVSFLILPVVLIETLVMPQTMNLIHASTVLPPTAPLIVISTALVNATLTTFSVVYDARLATHLTAHHPSLQSLRTPQ